MTNEPPYACASGTGEPDYCGPNTYRGVPDRLYRNDGGGFVDISAASGIAETARNGLGVVCFDFDGDAKDDFLVANDGERNQLWKNQGDGRFVDRAVRYGVATNIEGATEASMGIALGDVDGDRRVDALMTHLGGETNTLYVADSTGMLLDSSALSGVGFPSVADTGFGVALADFDQDADLDLAVANGRVQRSPDSAGPASGESATDAFRRLYADPNLLMVNDGQGRFDDHCHQASAFCTAAGVSRGLLTADIDADGDLDILVTNANGPVRLYRNDIPAKGNWLKLRLADPVASRDAIGAAVSVRLGDTWQMRPVVHATSYLSSADAQVHFGLGPAAAVDAIEVIWPDGNARAVSRESGKPVDRDPQGHGKHGRRLSMVIARYCRLVVTLAALVLCGCAEQTSEPAMPTVETRGMEASVRILIDAVARNLEGNRHSAIAWGRLGRVYHAHELYTPALVCYEQAVRLDQDDYQWPYLAAHAASQVDKDACGGALRVGARAGPA